MGGGSGYAMRWYVLTNPVTQPAMLLLVGVASHMPNCTDDCHKLATHMLRYCVHGVAAGCRRSIKRHRWGCRHTRLGCVWYPCAELQPTCITPRQPAVARLHTTGHTHARTHAHTRTGIDVARARVYRERDALHPAQNANNPCLHLHNIMHRRWHTYAAGERQAHLAPTPMLITAHSPTITYTKSACHAQHTRERMPPTTTHHGEPPTLASPRRGSWHGCW